jgi:hypothetical protein
MLGKSSKNTRAHFAFGAVHHDFLRQLAIALVAVGHALQHQPGGDAPARHREHQHRLQQAIRADAARQHHHHFAIG